MKSHCEMVREFMTEVAGQECPAAPKVLDTRTLRLRLRLIQEEFFELQDSCDVPDGTDINNVHANDVDYKEFIDALADLEYVIAGTYVAMGIDGEAVFREVHRSNMAKKGGQLRSDGKFVKPPTWTPPNIDQFVDSLSEDGK